MKVADALKSGYLKGKAYKVEEFIGSITIDTEGLTTHDAIQIALITADLLLGENFTINACDDQELIEISID